MKCRELMTRDPVFCLTTDTALDAAQLMERKNVGAVPVVSDPKEKKLIGLITDRDLALRVDAAGLDPTVTPIAKIMTRDIKICFEEDECQKVLETMDELRVRRVPIVDAAGTLVGIIAQADIARCVDNPNKVAYMLREISRPAGEIRNNTRPSHRPGEIRYKSGVLTAAGIGVGAALMYMFDPARGRARRSKLFDHAGRACRRSGKIVEGIGKQLANRLSGIAAETGAALRHEMIPDEQLVGRVRAKVGRLSSHPHAIQVSAQNGRVTLRGPVLAGEARHLLHALEKLPGVVELENQLELFETSAGVPELQNGVHSVA
jgi:CBS domain-containing protein